MATRQADILGNLARSQMSNDEVLRSIDESLQMIVDNGLDISQSSMSDLKGSYRSAATASNNRANQQRGQRTPYQEAQERWKPNRRPSNKGFFDEFTDEIEKQMMESLFQTSAIKDALTKSVSNFADELGVGVEDVAKEAGKRIGEKIAKKVQESPIGKELTDEINSIKDWGVNKFQGMLKKGADWLKDGDLPSMAEMGTNIVQAADRFKSAGVVAAEAAPEIAAMGEATVATAAAFPGLLLAIGAGVVAIELLSTAVGPAVDGLKKVFEASKAAANSTRELQKAATTKRIDRIKADVNSMIESSFEVVKDATQKMLDTWDASLAKITATQGYTKSDVQDLLSAYASRLKSEGLTSYVSTADLMGNLEKVLQSGLSGQVAEEFAYTATVLSKAIPTEDFFNYASTYASIAANAIAQGATQSQAISYANSQLEQFASNLLYSSRELAGGFSTGLTNASSLLEDAVKIANTAKSGNAANISGVLTSVSAIVGAIAPDLAGTLVDSIVSAAVGGNSSNIAALRSLSGVGASNTAFLNALASNPQAVFSELFTNLAGLQQMSNDNFMEVAEGLSDVFGVSMDAFARVDFNYLANAISNMDLNNNSLNQNMQLLISGQTTSSAEQLRMQELNQTMLEEGLTYVLDNEVARAMQQHMWDEERTQQLMEAEYAVNLTGSSLELLQGIQHTVQNVLNFLNPVKWIAGKVGNLINVSNQADAQKADLAAILEAGKVGRGNSLLKSQLLGNSAYSNKDYLQRLGKWSSSAAVSVQRDIWNTVTGQVGFGTVSAVNQALKTGAKNLINSAVVASRAKNIASSGVQSKYTWGNIGKSLASGVSGSYNQGSAYAALPTTASESMTSASNARLQKMLDTMGSFIDKGKSYDEWVETASSYGITNLSDALEQAGVSMQDVKNQYQDLETQAGLQAAAEKDMLEQKHLELAVKWYEEIWPLYSEDIHHYQDDVRELQNTLIDRADAQIKELIKANDQLQEFYTQWVDYYVDHTAYTQETLSAYDVAAIRNAERGEAGDAVLALAQALTSNAVDLKDPAVQTNVLLSQILIVAEAIMQQTNDTTTVSLPTALSALGLGVTSE